MFGLCFSSDENIFLTVSLLNETFLRLKYDVVNYIQLFWFQRSPRFHSLTKARNFQPRNSLPFNKDEYAKRARLVKLIN